MAKSIYDDNPSVKPVPVIASFSDSGEIIPLYFKYDSCEYKIENIISINKSSPLQIVFRCEIVDNNIKKQIKLSFMREDYCWLLGVR